MTKLLVEHWDKAALGLTSEQKQKLLVVRKNTIMGVRKIKKQLKDLEFEVSEAMIDRESVAECRKTGSGYCKAKS